MRTLVHLPKTTLLLTSLVFLEMALPAGAAGNCENLPPEQRGDCYIRNGCIGKKSTNLGGCGPDNPFVTFRNPPDLYNDRANDRIFGGRNFLDDF